MNRDHRSPHDEQTRDRIRGLVRQILDRRKLVAQPEDKEFPKHLIVNSLKEKSVSDWDRDESAKSLLTESDLLGLAEGSRVRIGRDVKLTPSATDFVKERKIVLVRKQPRENALKVASVAIGADHGGFQAKEILKSFLEDLSLRIRDFGTHSTEAVDYPDHAHAVAESVSNRQTDIGIIIDGAGIGSAMTANKVPDVRAAACYNPTLAANAREHNGANVLTLGSGQNSIEQIKDIVLAFLTTEISEERHIRRVSKIEAIELRYKK